MKNKAITISAAVALFGLTTGAYAAGTTAGTQISNQATVGYKLGGVDQTAESTTDQFVVDAKVDLLVTADPAGTKVNPNESVELIFTVKNTGNIVNDYLLTAVENATEGLDDIKFFLKKPSDANYSTTAATFIDELAIDDTISVKMTGTIPSAIAQGTEISYILLAEARLGDTPGMGAVISDSINEADTASMQYIFADGSGDASNDIDRDAKHSAAATGTDGAVYSFIVNTITLDVNKSSVIESDPVNTVAPFKALPGAVILYTITAENISATATGTAEGVVITDDLTELVGEGKPLTFKTGGMGSGDIKITKYDSTGNQVGSANFIDFNTNTSIIEVNTYDGGSGAQAIALAPGEKITVEFRVTIL